MNLESTVEKIIIIIIIIISILIGFTIGYMSGVGWALNWGVEKAIWFLQTKNITLDINTKMIAAGLYQYQNNLGGFINCDNARLYNNSRAANVGR